MKKILFQILAVVSFIPYIGAIEVFSTLSETLEEHTDSIDDIFDTVIILSDMLKEYGYVILGGLVVILLLKTWLEAILIKKLIKLFVYNTVAALLAVSGYTAFTL